MKNNNNSLHFLYLLLRYLTCCADKEIENSEIDYYLI